MKECQECRHINPPQRKICARCGTKFGKSQGKGPAPRPPGPAPSAPAPPPPDPRVTRVVHSLEIPSVPQKPSLRIRLVDETTGEVREFEGNRIALGRSDLAPEEDTISSREHVVFVHDGKDLTLHDRSSTGATFIQVQGSVPVPDRTTIVIGRKVFRLEVDRKP